MRIALLLSGHMRCYKELAENHQYMMDCLSKYGSVDIFVATWDVKNTKKCWSGEHGLTDESAINQKISVGEIVDYYNINSPRISIFDHELYESELSPLRYSLMTAGKPNSLLLDGKAEHNGVVHSAKMLYLMWEVNKLKLKEELKRGRYDLVIRSRPDYYYNKEISKFDFSKIESDKLYFCESDHGTTNDQFFFGDSLTMDKLNSSFLNVAAVYGAGIWFNPERVVESCFTKTIERGCKLRNFGTLKAENKELGDHYR